MTFENLCFDYCVNVQFLQIKGLQTNNIWLFLFTNSKNKNQDKKMRNYFVKKAAAKTFPQTLIMLHIDMISK